jgi:hypothetical protein
MKIKIMFAKSQLNLGQFAILQTSVHLNVTLQLVSYVHLWAIIKMFVYTIKEENAQMRTTVQIF